MTAPLTPGLAGRIAALVAVAVLIQISVVSEVPIFGINIDLSPLLVVFIGLLCGAVTGAVAGFAIGLLVDLTLLQTLGVSSLIFTVVGYGAGRLREVRNPQAALTPVLMGAAGTLAASVGYSLVEFLLGVDAPVSLQLLRQILLGVVVNAIVAPAVWALVRWALQGSLPEDPRHRRRRRRAYATGGLSPLSRA